MNPHPIYRRRRRVVVAVAVTLAALGLHCTGGADADIPTHRSPVTRTEWNNR